MNCQEYLTQNPNATIEELVDKCGVKHDSARRAWLRFFRRLGMVPPKPAESKSGAKKLTLQQWREKNDVPLIIRNGLTRCFGGTGNEDIMSDYDFREALDIHVNNWRRNSELDEFKRNRLKHGGSIYWASESTIKRMRHILGMPEEL